MDDLHAVNSPATEPGTAQAGSMSLSEAVKAAVQSTSKQFASEQTPSAEAEAPDNAAGEVLDAEPEGGSQDGPDAGDQGETERPVEGQTDLKEAKPSLEAPKNWPKDRRELFNSLPDDAKRIILDREREFNTGFTRNAQENAVHRKRSEALNEVFTPYRQEMEAAGLDEIGAIQFVLKEREAFNADPAGFIYQYASKALNGDIRPFIAALMQRAGLTLEHLAGQPQQQTQAEDEYINQDIIQAVERRLAPKLGAIDQIASQMQRLQQVAQLSAQDLEVRRQRQEQALNEEIEAFRTELDEEGNAKYPFFDELEGEMVEIVGHNPEIKALVARNPRQALEKAYSEAIFRNPVVRQKVLEAEREAERARWQKEREAEIALRKAKAAAPVKGSPGANGAQVPNRKMTLEEAVRLGVQQAKQQL